MKRGLLHVTRIRVGLYIASCMVVTKALPNAQVGVVAACSTEGCGKVPLTP